MTQRMLTMIWANLLHLSYNMWIDRDVPDLPETLFYRPYLRFDRELWNELLERMRQAGANMVVIDLGDGVRYASHPELAVENAWTVQELRAELGRIRSMGLEPIPKLNFSTTHDAWLGPYSRRVSTPEYYELCRDLIAEVIDLFDSPGMFHLGMDEETYPHQQHQEYVVVRQHDLWWHDLMFYVNEVEQRGGRAWIWSDCVWNHPEDFYARMPRSVLQSNWYYGAEFDSSIDYVDAYLGLEKHGYDQVPTGSNWSVDGNFQGTVEFCRRHIAPERLVGFLQTAWRPTLPEFRDLHVKAIAEIAEARSVWEAASRTQ